MIETIGVTETWVPLTLCADCGHSFRFGEQIEVHFAGVWPELEDMTVVAVHEVCEEDDDDDV